MEILEKYFDKYGLNARVKPAFFLVFPVVLSVVAWFETSRTWGGVIITFMFSFGIFSFAANQMSTKGNILQEKLFEKWGGAATTIILRHSDSRLDKYTKARYMEKLATLISNFKPVSFEQEQADPQNADEMYRTATLYLKEQTRDKIKYPLVLQENISYGFSRNIRAFKTLGVFSTLLCLAASSYLTWNRYIKGADKALEEVVLSVPFIYIGLLICLLFTVFIWIFLVTEKWVEIRAFAYAKALFRSCDQ